MLSHPAKQTWKVLFCGHMMEAGYALTQQAAQGHPGLRVEQCRVEDLADAIRDAHVAVPLMAALDATVLARASRLRMILQFGVGVEGVDVAAASSRGIMVSNIPSAGTGNGLSCAEHAIFLALHLLRRMPVCAEAVQLRRLGAPLGETLFGKTALVLGFGGIARHLVPRLKPFGVRVLCVRRSPWTAQDLVTPEAQMLDERGQNADLPRLLPEADIVFVAASQTAGSRGLVDRAFLQSCKDGVLIVNVARGGLLDRAAVWEGLEQGKVGGLGLDVQWVEPIPPGDPFVTHPRVVCTPHIAGVTRLSYQNMARVVVEESLRVRAGSAPAVWLNQASMQAIA